MRIFVTGGSGYIGSSVALACRRAGHDVFGLVRSADKGRELSRNEIRPVVGTLQAPETYLSFARHCSVLIHTAFDRQGDGVALDKKTVETLLNAGEKGAQPKTVIYTSGVWANGDTKCALVDETTPPAPIQAVASPRDGSAGSGKLERERDRHSAGTCLRRSGRADGNVVSGGAERQVGKGDWRRK